MILELTLNLFHRIAYDVWLDHKEERSINVPHFEFGESGRLHVFPCFSSDLATITKVVPCRLENVLEEV